jgi:hypothetical protein
MAKLTKSYNLQAINPELAQQWHPTKNATLTPKDVYYIIGDFMAVVAWELYLFRNVNNLIGK